MGAACVREAPQDKALPTVASPMPQEQRIRVVGDILNTDTRVVMIVLELGGIDFEFEPIDMSAKEHKSAEFLAEHPCGILPILIDKKKQRLYGGGLLTLMHISNSYPSVADFFSSKKSFDDVE